MNPEAGKIQAANDRFCESFRRSDAAAIAALYTADARLLPPNFDFVEGAAAIQAFWGALLKMGFSDARLESVDTEFLGDTAIEVGRYELRAGDTMADHGKYIVVWKKDRGAWKLHRDVWNSSVPAEKQQAA